MKLSIVLNGGLKSCCSTYPPEFVHETVKQWLEGVCSVEMIDAEKENWNPDDLAALAIKCFGQQAYPFLYIDDVLMDIGRIPPKEELIGMLSKEPRKSITYHDIKDAAKRYGVIKEEG